LVEPRVNILVTKLDAAMKSACESSVESKSAAARQPELATQRE
jgi:hypothetical protein